VIVTHSAGVLAAKDATTTIPIVMAIAGDPVGTGLVASLARPGGNVTGLSLGTEDGLSGKRLQLLTEAAPKLSRVGVLWNRAHPGVASQIADIRSAASILGVRLQLVEFRGSDELEGALASLAATRSDALIVPPPPPRSNKEHASSRSPPGTVCPRSMPSGKPSRTGA
jgi:putative tryptophan/tyrosine transport system substrate-binding protein